MNDKYKIKPNQLAALRKLLMQVASDKGGALYLCSRLVGRELLTLADVSQREWREIRDSAYPHWQDEDWAVSEAFRARLHALHSEYMETCGQRRLL